MWFLNTCRTPNVFESSWLERPVFLAKICRESPEKAKASKP
ncbi:hypothetical protein C427_2316 [Paraglaciecola psychrophila 170]|uniref:Uncharacterized protein n=1 Tax=Paraglaciecola psychrophila 170 TaxID=1129794 RepID=M4RLB8_9ALTE|nr:hypothetical protein C427_2316 [Paraglaciecola psychrophila 170]